MAPFVEDRFLPLHLFFVFGNDKKRWVRISRVVMMWNGPPSRRGVGGVLCHGQLRVEEWRDVCGRCLVEDDGDGMEGGWGGEGSELSCDVSNSV